MGNIFVADTGNNRIEVFNSDAAIYGGRNVGNAGAAIPSAGGRIEVAIPAVGFVVLVRQ